MSLSSLAFGFCPDFVCVVVRASSSASVSLVRGRLSLPGSSFNSVPGVQGLGNFPGQSFGMPLFPTLPRLPSLSTTCEPNETVFLPLLAVPGVRSTPPACFEGDRGGPSSFGGGSSTLFAFAESIFAFLACSLEVLLASSGAGVPNTACLNAFRAK